MGILNVNDMIPDFANFCTFKGSSRATAFSKVPATVGRGPVPRRAAITVGRGPVPRHAPIVTENAHLSLRIGRFLARLEVRGGQAPALR